MAERLDHARPLWAIDLVGPLDDGREADRRPHPPRDGRRDQLRALPLRGALGRARRRSRPRRSPRRAHGARQPRSTARASARLARLPGAVGRELGHRASRTALAKRIGSRRELAFTAVPLAELRAIGKSRPGHVTVNDVFLAGVAGGLRDWLACGARRLPRLRAQIPVSLHHRGESETELGNRDSYFNVDLPLARARPACRASSGSTPRPSSARSSDDAEELYELLPRPVALSPPRSRGAAARGRPAASSASRSPTCPGPRAALSVAGRTVERLCSVAEPADRHALRISAISCGGNVGIGLCTDPEAVEGVGELARAIDARARRAARRLRSVSVPARWR